MSAQPAISEVFIRTATLIVRSWTRLQISTSNAALMGTVPKERMPERLAVEDADA
jgi:hypothetical protein